MGASGTDPHQYARERETPWAAAVLGPLAVYAGAALVAAAMGVRGPEVNVGVSPAVVPPVPWSCQCSGEVAAVTPAAALGDAHVVSPQALTTTV